MNKVIEAILQSLFSYVFVSDTPTQGDFYECQVLYEELVHLGASHEALVRSIIPAQLEWQGGMSFFEHTTSVDSKEQVFMFLAKVKD